MKDRVEGLLNPRLGMRLSKILIADGGTNTSNRRTHSAITAYGALYAPSNRSGFNA
jgi:hypothetical protein